MFILDLFMFIVLSCMVAVGAGLTVICIYEIFRKD